MSELSLDNQLCFTLYNASKVMTKAYQPHLKKLGLTYPQYLAMLALWESDQCSVKALGERLLLDSGTLTPLLKRLEQSGLVNRQRSVDDERTVIISLTTQGAELQQQAVLMRQQLMCQYQGDRAQLTALKSQLDTLTKSMLDIQRST